MKKIALFITFIAFLQIATAQLLLKKTNVDDYNTPHWAKMMYAENPNVYAVEKEYNQYSATHEEEETPHTAYYKHWRRAMQPYVQNDGSIKIPSQQEQKALKQLTKTVSQDAGSKMIAPWSFAGPDKNFRARYSATDPVAQISWHANMYCIDRSMSNIDVLYAGGENGGVYKTIDKGLHWQYISLGEDMITVSSIAVNPINENEVLVNADGKTYKTIDGGTSWNAVGSPAFQAQTNTIWQFIFNPANTQLVFAGAEDSLYRSTDGGNTWSGVFGGECQSVAINPLDASIIYALRYDAVTKIANFYKSLDSGLTFTIKPTGWFTVPVADTGLIQSYGGRIAVTEADTSRIYVLLVGQSQSTAQMQLNGQIGIYSSNDGGESWSNPHGLIGMPYNANTHPNMMTFSGGSDAYNQIYYNTTLIASQLNADKIIIGGMSMWRSDDGAATYQPVGGYIGNVGNIHPDNQEFKIYKTSAATEEFWFASDGGINYSTDFAQTHESRANGIYGTALWGFDQGWNDDIMVGGRYHNGNAARRDGYPQGEFQQLGGGEAASGYVNYSNEKKTYFSDIDGIVLPDTLNGVAGRFPVNTDPNESYVDNSSSRIMFDWDYWNVAYLGKDNKIYKSTNGGSSFGELFSFGTVATDKVYWIEQSRANKNVLFAQQVINNVSKIWKTIDRGLTWNQIPIPQNKRELNFTLSYTNPNELWISYPKATNGNNIYHTINNGANWINTTTPTLNGFEIEAIAHQFGTDGGVYIGTHHGPVFYRNNTLTDWNVVGTNLPFISYPLRLVPFYRDNKIRLATWHLGVWENSLYEPSNLVADFSANYESFYCPGDTIRFVPHCVASANATYQWSFSGATPTTSTAMYPNVVYNAIGSYDVSLIVTDNGLTDTITKTNFIKTTNNGTFSLQENFESGSFNAAWKLEGTDTVPSNWNILNTAGGFGLSTYSMQYDNWAYDAHGAHDAVWTAKFDFTNVINSTLKFDVAYARYDQNYSDTLEVLASTDCGATFTSLYLKGGSSLATAPQNSSTPFIPTSSQWRTDSIDISSFAGYPEVIFSFTNIGRFGQILYVDNINLNSIFTALPQLIEQTNFEVYPNPFSKELTIKAEKIKPDDELNIVDGEGRTIVSQTLTTNCKLPTAEWSSGVYFVKVNNGVKKVVKE